jgi:hypothetical protein
MNKAVRVGNVSRALKQGAADCNVNREAILVNGLTEVDMIDSQRQARRVNLNDKDFTSICDWIRCSYQCKPSIDIKALPEDDSTYDIFAARFAEQSMILRLKKLFKVQTWFRWEDIQEVFKDIPKVTLTSLLVRAVNNPSIIFENGDYQGHLIYRNNLFIFQPNTIQDHAIPLALRYGRYPVKRDYYEPESVVNPPKPAILRAPLPVNTKNISTKEVSSELPTSQDIFTKEEVSTNNTSTESITSNIALARALWIQATRWIDTWAKDDATSASIVEHISNTETNPLSTSILQYFENDIAKKNNVEERLKKLQWWGKVVANIPGGLRDLRLISKQYVWDSFIKGPEQVALMQENDIEEIGNEQIISSGSVTAFRYLDISTRAPVYICGGTTCAPSVLQLFTSSKTDPVINAKAYQTTTAELYGFMVPWQNTVIFKTNEPKPVGKDPGPGAACSIVSTVRSHRMKLVQLGTILARYSGGNTYDLTDKMLTETRKLTGAPEFCALMEIVMRWMDIRRDKYGGLRFFYRPLSAYYSKHKGKK